MRISQVTKETVAGVLPTQWSMQPSTEIVGALRSLGLSEAQAGRLFGRLITSGWIVQEKRTRKETLEASRHTTSSFFSVPTTTYRWVIAPD